MAMTSQQQTSDSPMSSPRITDSLAPPTHQYQKNDSNHIYAVAAKTLKDCVDLLHSIQAAVIDEQKQEAAAAGVVCCSGESDITNDDDDDHRRRESSRPSTTHARTMCRTYSHSSSDSGIATSKEDEHREHSSGANDGSGGGETDGGRLVIEAQGLDGSDKGHADTLNNNRSSTDPQSTSKFCITPCKKAEVYTKPSLLACSGTIGKHVRHLHDHYRLLLTTYPHNTQDTSLSEHRWTVDYDARSRDVPMETDINVAIMELKKLQLMLEEQHRASLLPNHGSSGVISENHNNNLVKFNLLQPVTLQATIDPACPPVLFQSTFGRELWFCSLHAVHHFAMIKVICSEYGMSLTDSFGLAPSTAKSRLSKP